MHAGVGTMGAGTTLRQRRHVWFGLVEHLSKDLVLGVETVSRRQRGKKQQTKLRGTTDAKELPLQILAEQEEDFTWRSPFPTPSPTLHLGTLLNLPCQIHQM